MPSIQNNKHGSSFSKTKLIVHKMKKRKKNILQKLITGIPALKTNILTYIKEIIAENIRTLRAKYWYNCSTNHSEQNFFRNMSIYNDICKQLVGVTPQKLSTFITEDQKYSARYYASFLWNRNLEKCENESARSRYMIKCLHKMIYKLSTEDAAIIRKILLDRYFNSFAEFTIDFTLDDFKYNLFGKILENKKNVSLLVNVLHTWYLIFPILEELSKYLGWKYLRDVDACLLDVDTLYDILLSKSYGDIHENYYCI